MEVRSSRSLRCRGYYVQRRGSSLDQGQVEDDSVLQQGRVASIPEGRPTRRVQPSVTRRKEGGENRKDSSLSTFMNNLKNKKIVFIPGLGERAKDYNHLSKYMKVYDVDWNKIRLPRGKIDILIGFSMGAVLACEYAEDHKIDTVILCSLTPCIDTLERLKAKEIIFVVGEKEKWAYKNNLKLIKTIKCKRRIIIVPKADHRINKDYKKVLLDILEKPV